MSELENPTPKIYERKERTDDEVTDGSVVNSAYVFELLRDITDPEHPYTLEQLNVIQEDLITVNPDRHRIQVQFTPTIPHCSMATLIGLCLRTKLMRSLGNQYRYKVAITPGTHNTEDAINKQLDDKERVAAALENPYLTEVLNTCIKEPGESSGNLFPPPDQQHD